MRLLKDSPAMQKRRFSTRIAVSFQGDDRDQQARQSIREAIESNQPSRTRLRNYHKDGSLFWNELSITPIINEEDGLTYYIGVQKDVTREVEIELQLEQAQLEIQRLRNQLSE